jgi:RING/Ubox like zinc-binding domain
VHDIYICSNIASTMDDRSEHSNHTGYVARLDLSSRRFIQVEDFSPRATPDAHYMSITLNDPVSFDDQQRLNGELLANTMITGGFANPTVAHGLPRKVEERPKITANLCYMPGCSNQSPQQPCECGFKICKSCFKEANGPTGGGLCPGCNTLYEFKDPEETLESTSTWYPRPRVPSVIHAFEVNTEYDSESVYSRGGYRKNYGIGNASVWSEQSSVREKARAGNGSAANTDGVSEASEVRISGKSNRPLTRKLKVDATVVGAYRY